MPLLLPERADNAFEVLNARPPEKLRGVMFAWYPPDFFLLDRCPFEERLNINHLQLADDLAVELKSKGRDCDKVKRRTGTILWKSEQEDELATFDTNATELSMLPAPAQELLLEEIRKRIKQ